MYLDVYGQHFSLNGDWQDVLDRLGLDFAWFVQPQPAGGAIRVEIEQRPPDFDTFGDLAATFITPRNVVYQADGRTIVDYFGRALSMFDRSSGSSSCKARIRTSSTRPSTTSCSRRSVATSTRAGCRASTRSGSPVPRAQSP